MGRKRSKGNEWMPKGVFFRPSGYYWKPGGSTETFAPPDATKAEVWVAYEKRVSKERQKTTFKNLWDKFINSIDFSALATRTQKDYHAHAKYILKVFGDAEAKTIKPEHIRRYMDARGQKSTVQANHEHSSMSRVFRWSFQRGFVASNPCIGVDKFPKPKRSRYITDEEYKAIYDVAPAVLRAGMEIAYLCATRVSDILALEWSQVMDDGLFIQQRKTGVAQIKSWTPRLLQAIDLCRTHGEKGKLIKNRNGERYSYNGYNDLWNKAKQEAAKNLGYALDCTFHDLKAKGISDYEGSSRDKQLFSGHKTESQVAVYDRKTKVSPTLDRKLN